MRAEKNRFIYFAGFLLSVLVFLSLRWFVCRFSEIALLVQFSVNPPNTITKAIIIFYVYGSSHRNLLMAIIRSRLNCYSVKNHFTHSLYV